MLTIEVDLQTCSVSLNASMALPIPSTCAQSPTFTEIFGWKTLPYCTVQKNYEYCQWLQLLVEDEAYQIRVWERPPCPEWADERALSGEADTEGIRAPDIHGIDLIGVRGFPERVKGDTRMLRYRGCMYEIYSQEATPSGAPSWIAELLFPLVKESQGKNNQRRFTVWTLHGRTDGLNGSADVLLYMPPPEASLDMGG